MSKKYAVNSAEVAQAIQDRDPFETFGTMRGQRTGYDWNSWNVGSAGRLFRDEIDTGDIDYIIYSYQTPIAWHVSGAWRYVARRFSSTTSKHQSAIRNALRQEKRVLILQRDYSVRLTPNQSLILAEFATRKTPSGILILPKSKSRTVASLERMGFVHSIVYVGTPHLIHVSLSARGMEKVYDLVPRVFWDGRVATYPWLPVSA